MKRLLLIIILFDQSLIEPALFLALWLAAVALTHYVRSYAFLR